jgi:hypothetical protein
VLLAVLAFGCGTRPPGFSSFGANEDAAATPDAVADVTANTPDVVEDAGQVQPPVLFMPQDASPAGASDCAHDATAFVFVLSSAGDLYRFAPDAKVFTKIGALGCSSPSVPNSMAVDRHATAWVNYLDGTVRAVNTADAGCEGRTINMPSAWDAVGMGFATSDAGAASEALYVAGAGANASSGLGRLDLDAGTVFPVGSFTAPLTATDTELTGTGDGRLFGFFASSPVRLAQIDRTSAAIVTSTPFTQIGTPQFFAFSFWGGRFYFYTYPNSTPGSSTNVTEYDPKTGALNTTFMTDIGFLIVGAGVSTCAPTVPPTPK